MNRITSHSNNNNNIIKTQTQAIKKSIQENQTGMFRRQSLM
jgi:hypothetical protein